MSGGPGRACTGPSWNPTSKSPCILSADVRLLRSSALCELFDAGLALKERLRGRAALFVADRTDIAASVEADGVVLGDDGVPVVVARRSMPGPAVVARAVGDEKAALVAAKEGADLVFVRGSKSGGSTTLDIVSAVASKISVPVFARLDGAVAAKAATDAAASDAAASASAAGAFQAGGGGGGGGAAEVEVGAAMFNSQGDPVNDKGRVMVQSKKGEKRFYCGAKGVILAKAGNFKKGDKVIFHVAWFK